MLKYHYVLPYIIAAILAFLLFKSCERANTLQDLQTALNDSISQYRNKHGQQVSTISVLQTEREKDFLNLKSKDSTVKALQNVVKDYKGKLQSATMASTETTDTGKTVTIVKHDTVYIDGKPELKPVYSTSWADRWSEGMIEAHHDSIYRNIKVKNEFTFVDGYKRNLFKRDVLTTEMINLNENTVTKELRTYTKKVPKKRFSVGVGCTYGYSLTTWKPDAVVGVNASFILCGF